MMKKYRKKAIVIRAIQWKGDNINELIWSCPRALGSNILMEDNNLIINTLEGAMKASVGDWIICGIKGEFYPCKPDIFEMTYEEVENGNHSQKADSAS